MASLSLRTRLGAAGLLLFLLALSLGLKFVLANRSLTPDEARLLRDITARFHDNGYATAIVDRRFQTDIVVARRGACLAAARNGDDGTMVDAQFRQDMAGVGPLRYLYDGTASERPPRVQPALTLSTQYMLGRIGIAISREPVIALAAGPGCAIPADFFAGLRLHLMPAAPAPPGQGSDVVRPAALMQLLVMDE